MVPILETERLHLRPITIEDLDHYIALAGDPDVMRFIGTQGALTPEQSRERVEFMLDHWRQHGFGMWSVFRKADGVFVGRCGFRYLDNTTEIELGYTLGKVHWGQGYATEASRAVLRYAFEVMKLKRLVAIADPANTASVNVMRKVGMTFEGMGRFYDTECVLYALADSSSPESPPRQ
jgi:ribosomal-protein-alanine N-acetyltransferase